MTTAARVWDTTRRHAPADERFGVRADQYEQILGQIATGVFIMEPAVPGVASSLEVTFVNEMGALFFGRTVGSAPEVLADASH